VNPCHLLVGCNAFPEHPSHITPFEEASTSETPTATWNLFKAVLKDAEGGGENCFRRLPNREMEGQATTPLAYALWSFNVDMAFPIAFTIDHERAGLSQSLHFKCAKS
jgi:hypothetical protein